MNGNSNEPSILPQPDHQTAPPPGPAPLRDTAAASDREPDRLAFGPHTFRPTPLWKRSFDLLSSVVLIVLLSPLLIIIALFIRVTSPGPILFRQLRVGAMGRSFEIWKFRTMCTSVDSGKHRDYVKRIATNNGRLVKNDNQLIPLGWLLRATGLDELPQLFNILWGDMSLVGPRPDILAVADYKPWQLHRFDVLPGLTGLWQVSGKNRTTFDEMIALDLHYVARRSFSLDARILCLTIPAILQQACSDEDG